MISPTAQDFFTAFALGFMVVALGMLVLAFIAKRQRRGRPRRRFAWAVGLGIFGGAGLVGLSAAHNGGELLAYSIAALFGLLALSWVLHRLCADRACGRRRCPQCWYDMSATEGRRCPECGREAKREKKLFRTRRRWRLAMVALLPLLFAGYIAVQPKVQRDGWASIMPTTALIWSLRGDGNDWALQEIERRTREPHPDFLNAWVIDIENLPRWQIRQLVDVSIARVYASTDLKVRAKSIEWLDRAWAALEGDQKQAEINEVYAAMLDDTDPIMRGAGTYRVVRIFESDPGQSIDLVAPLLDDPVPLVRQHALIALARTTKWRSDVVRLIAERLDDEDLVTRKVALSALQFCADDVNFPADVVERVRKMADDPADGIRHQQIKTLAAMLGKDEARDAIAQALEHGDAIQREGALWAHYNLLTEPPTAADRLTLVHALEDEDIEVRRTAAWMIEQLGFEQFVEFRGAFEAGLDADARPDAAVFIADVLERIDAAMERDAPR
jgi:ssDNA-binding Zn-finger/Zn-ribbon topoisomerase 1